MLYDPRSGYGWRESQILEMQAARRRISIHFFWIGEAEVNSVRLSAKAQLWPCANQPLRCLLCLTRQRLERLLLANHCLKYLFAVAG